MRLRIAAWMNICAAMIVIMSASPPGGPRP